MAPGDFSQLSRSSELAFRATFSGSPPPMTDLYWRGLVFSQFDGRRWNQAPERDYYDGAFVDWNPGGGESWLSLQQSLGREYRYRVMLEPTQQDWLYSLASADSSDSRLGRTRDFRLQANKPVRQRFEYAVVSYLDYRHEVEPLPKWRSRRELQLPAGYNPQTQQMARQWREQLGSDRALLDRFLAYVGKEFVYTLQPPRLGLHSVDEFLWQSRRGFCEHFASSFVVFMRAAGIPARVVVGYQGGEPSAERDYLLIRQSDAHAWAEVWLPQRGWLRIDPTAAVAPERIEQGLSSALSDRDSHLLGGGRKLQRLNQLRLEWDQLSYNWHRWVINYDRDLQVNFLQAWLGGTDPWRIALALMLVAGVSLLAVFLWGWWQARGPRGNPADKYYRSFCRKMSAVGLARDKRETPRIYALRIRLERPDLALAIHQISQCYERVSYSQEPQALLDLARAVRQFRPRKQLRS